MSPNPDQRTDVVFHASVRSAPEEFSLIGLITVVLRYRRLVIGVAVGLFGLTVLGTLLQRSTYTATGSFVPSASDAGTLRLSGLAAQFGFAMPTGEPGESPEFYAGLLQSPEILKSVVETQFEFFAPPDRSGDSVLLSGNLIDLMRVDKGTYERSREFTMIKLRRRVTVTTVRETGGVRFSVTTNWPALSGHVANRILELLNEFNMESRRSQAAVERQFVEGRLDEVRDELLAAENLLQSFFQSNRDFQDSPQLTFHHDRLQRDVLHRQQVVTSLTESYEQARIDEVRNTPVLTVVETPTAPVYRNRRRLLLKGFLSLVLGGVLGLFSALGRDFLRRSRETDSYAYGEMVALRKEAFADLRKVIPRLRSGEPKER